MSTSPEGIKIKRPPYIHKCDRNKIIGIGRKREIRQGIGTGVQLAPYSRSLDTRDPHDVTLFTFKASLGNRSPSAVPALEDGDLKREREAEGQREKEREIER